MIKTASSSLPSSTSQPLSCLDKLDQKNQTTKILERLTFTLSSRQLDDSTVMKLSSFWSSIYGLAITYNLLLPSQRFSRDFWRRFEDHRLHFFQDTLKNRTFVNTLKTVVYHEIFSFLKNRTLEDISKTIVSTFQIAINYRTFVNVLKTIVSTFQNTIKKPDVCKHFEDGRFYFSKHF